MDAVKPPKFDKDEKWTMRAANSPEMYIPQKMCINSVNVKCTILSGFFCNFNESKSCKSKCYKCSNHWVFSTSFFQVVDFQEKQGIPKNSGGLGGSLILDRKIIAKKTLGNAINSTILDGDFLWRIPIPKESWIPIISTLVLKKRDGLWNPFCATFFYLFFISKDFHCTDKTIRKETEGKISTWKLIRSNVQRQWCLRNPKVSPWLVCHWLWKYCPMVPPGVEKIGDIWLTLRGVSVIWRFWCDLWNHDPQIFRNELRKSIAGRNHFFPWTSLPS